MSRRLTVAVVLLTLAAVPLHADFSAIAQRIADQKGVTRVSVPFLGLARIFLWVAAPEGVHDFELATFEGADNLDPAWLHDVMQRNAGRGYAPLVQVWSRRSNEWSFIYARPSSNSDRLDLLILSHDSGDTVLVRVAVDATVLAHELRDEPIHVTEMSRH